MPLYVRDYIADTVHLSALEHGAYLMLIMNHWLHGSVPTDAKLARIARLDCERWTGIRRTLVELFEPGWRHKRVEAELASTKGSRPVGNEVAPRDGPANREPMLKLCVVRREAMLKQMRTKQQAGGLNTTQLSYRGGAPICTTKEVRSRSGASVFS
jgi:uncharacterized protein YdaU (DUF1376 family)